LVSPDSETKAFAVLKVDLDEEKVALVTTQVEVDVLSQAVRDLKIYADKFATQIPNLEDKVKLLENKVVDRFNKIGAWELCLECTSRVNDNYQKQVTQLSKSLESKFFDCI
jgi:hypothetical protein